MKRLKKKYIFSLWLMFAGSIFLIFISTAFIMMAIAFALLHGGYLTEHSYSPLSPIAFLLLISAIIGTIISLIVGRKILMPISRFSEASKEVAKGNFTVRLNENSRISEVQEMMHNFNVMTQELASIETLRTDFVVNVSHEFKTPLAAIEGYAMLLQDRELNDNERDEYTKMIIDSSRQLSILTENILKLSKLENQEVIIDQKSFRLDEQIRESILLLESKWNEKEIDMDIDLPKVTYYGSKNLLMQVWLNLIDNAIKFSVQGGRIRIRMTNDSHHIVVEIQDNGRGISPAEMRHIFDKFYQGDNARKESGNGLGLAMAKRIIDLCRGHIAIESKEKEGSTFIVTLPTTVS